MKEKNLLSNEIASKIKQLMKKKNLSQRRVAKESGIKEGYLGYLLRGEKRFNLIHIEKICVALDYPVAKLFEDILPEQPSISPVTSPLAEHGTPLELALIEVFRGLSSKHKGALLSVAEDLRLTEAIPSKVLKKERAAA